MTQLTPASKMPHALPPSAEAKPQPFAAFYSLRWRKTVRDLSANKTQTILVILSIAIGIFAFGMIATARATMQTKLSVAYLAVNPASATLNTLPLDDNAIDTLTAMPELASAEGRYASNIRYQSADGAWHDMQLSALSDYTNNNVNMVNPVSGAWPPPDRTLTIERNSLALTGAELGDTLTLRLPNGVERTLPVSGLLHDMNQPPAQVTGIPQAYVSRDTLGWFNLPIAYNQIHLVVAEDPLNKDHISAVAELADQRLSDAGYTVLWKTIPEPGEHFVMDFLPTIILILSVLGLLALVLSGFLVVNVISAVLTRHIRQIGIMKTIGARRRDLINLYMRQMLIVGGLATLIAIPLSILAGQAFSRFIAAQLNFDLEGLTLYPTIIAAQLFVGVLLPMLVAFYPVSQAANTSVQAALQEVGLGQGNFGTHGLDRLIMRLQEHLPISRPLRLSIRNTFRRKGRLARTVITLMLASAIFMAVLSVRASLYTTLEDALAEQGYDVQIQMVSPQRNTKLARELALVEGISAVENWSFAQAVPVHPDGSEGSAIILYALPIDSQIFIPSLTQGHWLTDSDSPDIVVGAGFIAEEPTTSIGSSITLRIGETEQAWTVLGINDAFQPPIAPPVLYISQSEFSRLMGRFDQTDTVRIISADHTPTTHAQISASAVAQLESAGLPVRSTRTGTEDRIVFGERFNIITIILMAMAMLLALVGGLGLMGTMSINVLERRREIGVMRAIGASDRAVLAIVIIEAWVIAFMAWIGGILLSQPLSRIVSNIIGMTFMQQPLHYTYDWRAPLIWLMLLLFIGTLSSSLPARQAANLSVRETIAYE